MAKTRSGLETGPRTPIKKRQTRKTYKNPKANKQIKTKPDMPPPIKEPELPPPIREEDKTPTQKEQKKRPKNTIKITSKVYPIDTPNSKNIKIGQYNIHITSDDFPTSSVDEANYLVSELVNYSNFMGNYKDEYTKEHLNKTNKNFFKADTQDWYMVPITYKEKDEDSTSNGIITNKDGSKTKYIIIDGNKKTKIKDEIKQLQMELEKMKGGKK